MLLKRQSECATVYLVAVVLLALHLTRTEAATLRKTEKRDGRKEATASSIREGVIVFGKGPKNASLDDDAFYQADFPGLPAGFPRGKVFDVSSKEAQWKRMSPSLLCGSDQMKFRAVGSPVKFLALNQNPPMPLSHVPTNCGYNMQGTPFGLVIDVPYGGCYILQEDGHYILPLLWNGIPVSLKCPKPHGFTTTAAPVTVTQLPYTFTFPWSLPTTAAPQDPTPPQMFPPGFHNFPHFLYLFKLFQKTHPSASMQDPALWQSFLNHWYQLNQKTSQSSGSPQDVANFHAHGYDLYQVLLAQNQASTTSPPQDSASLQAYLYNLYQQQLNQNQVSTTSSPQDSASLQAYLYHLYQQQLNQNQASTTSPPKDSASLQAYLYHLYQQLLNQNQASTTSSPQDSASSNAYLYYLYQLLPKLNQQTTATPQDPLHGLPKGMSPYFYHFFQHLYKGKESTTPAPTVAQNPVQSHFGAYMYPWVYEQSKLSYPYWYSLYASQASTGAPTTAPPHFAQGSWYGQSGNMPLWWFSHKPSHPDQVPWWHKLQTTAPPTTTPPGRTRL